MRRLAATASTWLVLGVAPLPGEAAGPLPAAAQTSPPATVPPPQPLRAPPLEGALPGPVELGEPPTPGGGRPPPVFPFAPEEDRDGSRFVWFVVDRAGLPVEYLPADALLASPWWEPVPRARRRPGDVLWWKGFVAVYLGERPVGEVGTAEGRRRLESLERQRGPARFLRLAPPPPLRPAPRSLAALGCTVRYANPDPGAWHEAQARLDGPGRSASVTLERRPLRDVTGREVVPTLALREVEPGPSLQQLVLAQDGQVVERAAESPGSIRRLARSARHGLPYREVSLYRLDGAAGLVASCSASSTTWRLVERECEAFLGAVALEPRR